LQRFGLSRKKLSQLAAMMADFQGLSILDTTTLKWRPPTRQQSTNHPFWSPDGAWVYFNDLGDTGLWRVRVSDGNVEALGGIPNPAGYNDCWAESFARMERCCCHVSTREWTFWRWITKS
jgi:hypothetical protein